MPRARRVPASLDLRVPSVAVWPGEVVVVAAPDRWELDALLGAARGPRTDPSAVREPATGYLSADSAADAVRGLTDAAARGEAVLAGVHLRPGPAARRTVAALRRRIGRRAPCRCVWLVDGRVYPE